MNISKQQTERHTMNTHVNPELLKPHKPFSGPISEESFREIFVDLDFDINNILSPHNPLLMPEPLVSISEATRLLGQWIPMSYEHSFKKIWLLVGLARFDEVSEFIRISSGAPVRTPVWRSYVDRMRELGNEDLIDDNYRTVWRIMSDFLWAYSSSMFPNVAAFKDGNPYQPAIDLWLAGYVPTFDGTTWRLHAGEDAAIVWEGETPVNRKHLWVVK